MTQTFEKALDHFRNPRNVGEVPNPDGVGQIGPEFDGDVLKVMFKLGEDKRIADVKFKVFGCVSSISSASALTEIVKGMTIEDVGKVTAMDIVRYLELPKEKAHCTMMALEALAKAILDYKMGLTAEKSDVLPKP